MTQGEPGAARLAGRAQKAFGHVPFLRGRHGAQAFCLQRVQRLEDHAATIQPLHGAGKHLAARQFLLPVVYFAAVTDQQHKHGHFAVIDAADVRQPDGARSISVKQCDEFLDAKSAGADQAA